MSRMLAWLCVNLIGPQSPCPCPSISIRFRFSASFLWTARCRRHKFIAAINCNINLFYFNISHWRCRCRRLYRRRIILISRHLARLGPKQKHRLELQGLVRIVNLFPSRQHRKPLAAFISAKPPIESFLWSSFKALKYSLHIPAIVSIGRCNLASDRYKWRERSGRVW